MAEELLDIQPLELKFTCKYTKFRIPPFFFFPPFFNLKIMMLSFVFMVITVIYLSSGRKGLF